MKNVTITIQTRLADGIYKSQGGGEVRVHYEWATGPLNLLKAVRQMRKHRKEIESRFGNIGCGKTWLEINGIGVHQYDLEDINLAGARQLLASIKAGTYNPDAYSDSYTA